MLRVVGTDGVFYFGIWGEIDKLSSKLGDFYILAEIKKCGKLINMCVLFSSIKHIIFVACNRSYHK